MSDDPPYLGNWVAFHGDEAVAWAPTIKGVVDILFDKHPDKARGSLIRFEDFPENAMNWSVQYASRPGHIYPNCLFRTRKQAAAWVNMGEDGTVWTRDGYGSSWRLASDEDGV